MTSLEKQLYEIEIRLATIGIAMESGDFAMPKTGAVLNELSEKLRSIRENLSSPTFNLYKYISTPKE